MRFFGVLGLPAALFVSLSVSAAPSDTGTPGDPAGTSASGNTALIAPGLADRDNDRISDGLGAEMAAAARGEKFDVVVTFAAPGLSAATARGSVGPFAVTREFSTIRGFAATMTAAQITALSGTPGVHRIEEDFTVNAMIDGATADFGVDSAYIDFTVDGAGTAMGRPVGICVIDTGIAAHHEQLDNGKVVAFFDAINGLTSPYDDQGHGTHVSSIAAGDGIGGISAATYKGVAPRAALYGAKSLNEAGSGTDSQVVAGVDWCAAQSGVDILSMSIGTAAGSDGNDALSLAVNCVADPGWSSVCGDPAADPKIVVVGAGNSGPDNETVGAPGAAEKAITVGAVANWSGDGHGVYLAAFSSRGPTLDGRPKPDITAPGMRIAAADFIFPEGYVIKSGTSMATPFISGVVALMLDANPDLRFTDPATGRLPVDRIRDILAATAQDRGPDGADGTPRDNEYGFGLVDAYAAVARAAGLAPGQYGPTRLPRYLRTIATVPGGGDWFSDPIRVAGDGTPLAATITIEGKKFCTLGGAGVCRLFGFGWAWTPDLDMQLIDDATGAAVPAAGGDITLSECPASGEYCGVGRQETVYYQPPTAGVYRLRVYDFGTKGGTFALEVSGIDTGLIANAGPDQVLYDNDADGVEAVTLDGSQSSHDDGTIVSYEWYESGALIAEGATATVDLALGSHTVTLTVTDGAGNTESDLVDIGVLENPAPVANAGPDRTVSDNDGNGTESVPLDATASVDPAGGTIVTYQWSEAGTSIAMGATPTVPLALGTHDIVLTVTDNGGATASDTVVITVTANQTPVADAGVDQTAADNDGDGVETVLLDGSASVDPGGVIVSYEWWQGTTLAGSGTTLSQVVPVGSHEYTLTVTDAAGASDSDTTIVTIQPNQAPVANAGPDQTATDLDHDGVESFVLDGSGSSDPGGGTIVSYEWSESGAPVGSGPTLTLTRGIGIHEFTLTVVDEAGASASDQVTVTIAVDPNAVIAGVGDIIVDELDPSATIVGDWTQNAWVGGGRNWNDYYHWINAGGTGANSITWTPDLPQAGPYKVYARWPEADNHPPAARYRIRHDGGETVVTVNEQMNGGQWVYLGIFNMTPDAGQQVVLRDDAPGVTAADAVRFVYDPTGVGEVIVDELDPEAAIVGNWTANGWVGGGRLWNDRYHWINAGGTGANSITWTPNLPQAGTYKVYARWPEADNHPSDAKYRIRHDGGETVVTVSEQMNGGQWVYLGLYAMTPGAGQQVQLRDDAAGVTAADAVKFVFDPTGLGELIVDELDPSATIAGAWTANGWTGGGRLWNDRYHWVNAGGSGANSVTWIPDLPQAGPYKVYARWPEADNHPTDAKYRIHHDGGEAIVTVSEQMNGDQWVYLGAYNMTPGAGQQVVLRDDAAGVTAADAIRFVAVGAVPGS